MQLSKRLMAVASMVTEGSTLADVGTDHGYIPIYLTEQKKIRHAIAMDINRGPLERAKEHIRMYGLGEYIEIRRSDGLEKLSPGEAQAVVIAGMGGALIRRILKQGENVLGSVRELILEPQSETEQLRRFLLAEGYAIVKEDMVFEDGKFYPVMKAVHEKQEYERAEYYRYGKALLLGKHPVLLDYLKREERILNQIASSLGQASGGKSIQRMEEIKQEMQEVSTALRYYEM